MMENPANIEGWANWLNLETFNDPQILFQVECCAKFCMRIKHGLKPSWLTLLGVSGVGKTHAAQRVWQWAKTRFKWDTEDIRFQSQRIYWPEFIEDLREGIGFALYRDIRNWPVLFLDDIGAERDTTGFAAEKLNTTLGCRVGKWTIITSNKSMEQLAEIDTRISDRIIREPGNIYVETDTMSYGLRKRSDEPEALSNPG